MTDKLKEAIEKLKWLSEQISPSPIKEAIDTVVAEVEKPKYMADDMEAFALWVNENYAIEPERSSPKQIIWYEHGFMDSEEFTLTQLRELWEKERRAK